MTVRSFRAATWVAACLIMLPARGGESVDPQDVAVAGHDDRAVAMHDKMAAAMQMDDTALFGKLMLDQLEWRDGRAGEARAAWDVQAWYGGDYNKVWLRTEGTWIGAPSRGPAGSSGQGVRDGSVDLLWNHAVSPWWSLQAGARQDVGHDPSRTWAAIGVQGLAPQWFETEATLYVRDAGHAAGRLKGQYDLLLTQRLIVQPYLEANVYSRSDPSRQLGSGLSDLQASLRLRYEVRREVAPYLGILWMRSFGGTRERLAAMAVPAGGWQAVVGLRLWF